MTWHCLLKYNFLHNYIAKHDLWSSFNQRSPNLMLSTRAGHGPGLNLEEPGPTRFKIQRVGPDRVEGFWVWEPDLTRPVSNGPVRDGSTGPITFFFLSVLERPWSAEAEAKAKPTILDPHLHYSEHRKTNPTNISALLVFKHNQHVNFHACPEIIKPWNPRSIVSNRTHYSYTQNYIKSISQIIKLFKSANRTRDFIFPRIQHLHPRNYKLHQLMSQNKIRNPQNS